MTDQANRQHAAPPSRAESHSVSHNPGKQRLKRLALSLATFRALEQVATEIESVYSSPSADRLQIR